MLYAKGLFFHLVKSPTDSRALVPPSYPKARDKSLKKVKISDVV